MSLDLLSPAWPSLCRTGSPLLHEPHPRLLSLPSPAGKLQRDCSQELVTGQREWLQTGQGRVILDIRKKFFT